MGCLQVGQGSLLSPLSSFSIAAVMTQRLLREQCDFSTRNNNKIAWSVSAASFTNSHFDIFPSVELTKKDGVV